MSEFPTASPGYRRLLRAEAVLLKAIYPHLKRAAEAREAPPASEQSNALPNMLGNLIPERAVPGAVPGWVIAQHVTRYSWAISACADQRVVELGSGAGYGTFLLSWVAQDIVGLDIDSAVTQAAAMRYPGVRYETADILGNDPLPVADIAVCFEVLEHVDDPRELLARALASYPRLILSFPNPLYHGSHLNPHHRVDWSLRRLKTEIAHAGGQVTAVMRQRRRDPAVIRRAFPWSSIWLFDVRSATCR